MFKDFINAILESSLGAVEAI